MKRETAIAEYFKAWEMKDWNTVRNFLDDDFHFTSPNGDDGISLEAFREKCWPQAENIQRFSIKNIAEHGNIAFVKYECKQTDETCFQNTELFVFKDDKLKSVEVFLGRKECNTAE